MIEPTIGRIVWYKPGNGDLCGGDQPLASIVCYVWDNNHVNLAVFDANGSSHSRTSVLLIQPEDDRPEEGPFCEWMPFQKGQAIKTEKLEEKLQSKD